jgi:hypothetical protein
MSEPKQGGGDRITIGQDDRFPSVIPRTTLRIPMPAGAKPPPDTSVPKPSSGGVKGK